PFPLFDAEKYLQSGFARRLPKAIRDEIREHGLRNSHLLSIAPTGTISLAFGDNVSNGIEPAFSWRYNRRKRTGDGFENIQVEDHAYRLYKEMAWGAFLRDTQTPDEEPTEETEKRFISALPEAFVSALEISAADHQAM